MIRRHLLSLIAVVLALGQLSCAAANLTPARDSMPAARAALRPEFRLFYDALQEDGDWMLIEPYGYVFRPRVSFISWRPYQQGFWVPSDVYGWVWVSTEPFGWITFHYGDWLFDHFQGWVWVPGGDWGPAWVAWAQEGDYIGWTPLQPGGSTYSGIPGGAYNYVPASQLAATNLSSHVVSAAQLGAAAGSPEPILNMAERDGVQFNRGPKFEAIERVAGPLNRVKLEDVTRPGAAPAPGRRESAAAPKPPGSSVIANTRRAAVEAAREAKSIAEQGAGAPASVPVVRPTAPTEAPAETLREPRRGRVGPRKGDTGATPAPADSSR